MKEPQTIITYSPQETQKLAKKLARDLKGGEIIALEGDLGSGKTTFIQGLAKGLGIKKFVSSPSFVLMKQYPIRDSKLLCHLDLYRLKPKEAEEEVKNLGLKEYLGRPDTIVSIEWADKIKNILPKDVFWIKFDLIDENKRKIKIT